MHFIVDMVGFNNHLLLSSAAGIPRMTEGSGFGSAAVVAQLLPTRENRGISAVRSHATNMGQDVLTEECLTLARA